MMRRELSPKAVMHLLSNPSYVVVRVISRLRHGEHDFVDQKFVFGECPSQRIESVTIIWS